jgi:uncharacterized protein (TIGR02001 family)
MKTKILALSAISAACVMMMSTAMAEDAPAMAEDAPAVVADPGPITANVTLASEYRYRGIAQTNSKPAIQGGFDYAHESGFYAGNWNSNISWVSDTYQGANPVVSAPIEMDFYAGFKKEVTEGVTLDGGVLQYYYPTSNLPTTAGNPNTTEVYAAGTYSFATLKYSYSLSDLFGQLGSKGSSYVDLALNYDTGVEGIVLNAHVGYQKVAGSANPNSSYTDWKLGLTKDLGHGMNVAVAYIGTNADGTVAFYQSPTGQNLGRGTGLISFTKTF